MKKKQEGAPGGVPPYLFMVLCRYLHIREETY